jgi:hypothetical protein
MDDLSDQIAKILKKMDQLLKEHLIYETLRISRLSPGEQCWCGSEILYRNCHLNREQQRHVTKGESRDAQTRIFNDNKYCCATFDKKNCRTPIVGAHTVQRGRVLASLARKGHVGTFYRNTDGFQDVRSLKTGIRKDASIFYGFCEYHDVELFREIEINEFQPTLENCWSSSYRAICHESYQKNAGVEVVSWQLEHLDKGHRVIDQVLIQDNLRRMERDIQKGLSDITAIKHRFEEIHTTKKYCELVCYVIEFDQPLSIAVCASISPFYDIENKKFQNLGNPNEVFQHYAISTITLNGNAGYVVCHLEEHEKIGSYLSNVFSRDPNFVKNWLTKSIFAYTENCYFDLDWWGKLATSSQESIFELAMSENYENEFEFDDLVGKEVGGQIAQIHHLR